MKRKSVIADRAGEGSALNHRAAEQLRLAHIFLRRLAFLAILALGAFAHGQEVGQDAPPETAKGGPVESNPPTEGTQPEEPASDDSTKNELPKDIVGRFFNIFSQKEDPDGPINTDRPTFTPANTVVPKNRLQFESGFTYNYQTSPTATNNLFDAPEIAMRYGLYDRVEFRMFWEGPTVNTTSGTVRARANRLAGTSDTEIGFKWQLLVEDKERKWIPITALITSMTAPTGGTSALSSGQAEPYINLIYAWNLSSKLTFGGSTGYLGLRQQPDLAQHIKADNYQRWHQSIVAFYALNDRITFFYEWYALMFTNYTDNRPLYYMDGGLLYHLTPNIQLDARAGFGLTGRPDDFFTGTGVSFRF